MDFVNGLGKEPECRQCDWISTNGQETRQKPTLFAFDQALFMW